MKVHYPGTLIPPGITVKKGHPAVMQTPVWRQVRFPGSHRKRIRRKWRSDQRNWTLVNIPNAVKVGNTIICHPDLYETLAKGSVSSLLNNQNLGPRPSDIILGKPDWRDQDFLSLNTKVL